MFEQLAKDILPQARWFDAAKNGESKYIEDNLYKNFGRRDIRRSDISQSIFKGFTALAYACYNGHLRIVQALVDYEFSITTKYKQRIYAPGYTYDTIIIPRGVNSLVIAILRNQVDVVQFLLRYLHSRMAMHPRIIGVKNFGMTTYLYASLCQC